MSESFPPLRASNPDYNLWHSFINLCVISLYFPNQTPYQTYTLQLTLKPTQICTRALFSRVQRGNGSVVKFMYELVLRELVLYSAVQRVSHYMTQSCSLCWDNRPRTPICTQNTHTHTHTHALQHSCEHRHEKDRKHIGEDRKKYACAKVERVFWVPAKALLCSC